MQMVLRTMQFCLNMTVWDLTDGNVVSDVHVVDDGPNGYEQFGKYKPGYNVSIFTCCSQ